MCESIENVNDSLPGLDKVKNKMIGMAVLRQAKIQKTTASLFKITVLLTDFIDCRAVVHSEFFPPGQILSKEYYVIVLKHLRANAGLKRPEFWRNNSISAPRERTGSHLSSCKRLFDQKQR